MYIAHRLEFAKGPPAEPGGPPVFTSEILAMLSPEQEKVPLQKVTTDTHTHTHTHTHTDR